MKNPKKPEQFVDLYQIYASVDATEGVKTTLMKYRTKFTGQNYLSTMMTKEDHAAGYNVGWGSSRLGQDELLKVKRSLFADKPGHVKRTIWFLEGQQDQAVELLRFDMEETVRTMYEETTKLYKMWRERPSQKADANTQS